MENELKYVWGGKSYSPGQWASFLGGNTSEGNGIDAYMSSGIAAAAVQLRCEAISSAPLKLRKYVMETNPKTGKRENVEADIDTHPLIELVYSVNTEWNYSDLMTYTEAAYLIFGAAYWRKIRGAGGRVVGIMGLNPAHVTIKYDSTGISGFRYQPSGNANKYDKGDTYPRADVVYFKGAYNPYDDLKGLAPLRWALTAALGDKNAQQYISSFFSNFATPMLVMSTDIAIPESALSKITEGWKRHFQGVTNFFKTAFVANNLKPHVIGGYPKDLAIPEVRAAIMQNVCIALRVPELLLSPTNAADLTPVEMAQRLFYENTIVPRWKHLQETIDAELVSEYADLRRLGAFVEFDYSQLSALQESEENRVRRFVMMVQAGIIRPEVAAVELGFDESDSITAVPETLGDIQEATPTVGGGTGMPRIQARSIGMADELNKWERKALAAVNKGKAASVPFEARYIPAAAKAALAAALDEADNSEDVACIFRDMVQWGGVSTRG